MCLFNILVDFVLPLLFLAMIVRDQIRWNRNRAAERAAGVSDQDIWEAWDQEGGG